MPPSSSDGYQVLRINPRKGVGLFATRKFNVGESIYRLDYWSHEQMPMHATNHSCDPNARFDEGGMLVAVREIEPGEEITYDYVAHPLPASPWNFRCDCEAEGCVGWIDVGAGKGVDDSLP
jgi:SET domain-containing protein